MVLNAYDSPDKETWQFVRFLLEADLSVLAAYTDKDSDEVFEGTLYTSETAMEVKIPTNNGLLDEQPLNLVLPELPGFVSDISSGAPYPSVIVEVVEFTRAEGVSSAVARPFRGLIAGVRRNYGGRKRLVAMSALPVKARMASITLGEPCNHQCINRLGDGRCGVPLVSSPNRLLLNVSAIDGTKVTASTAVPTGLEDRFYQRGYAARGGLFIAVQIWRNEVEGNKQEFFLARRPPSSWLGQQMIVFAGCDKTKEVCISRFNNEANFNGRGYRMPAYHPNFEDGGARQ